MKKLLSVTLVCTLMALLLMTTAVMAQAPDTIYFSKTVSIQVDGKNASQATVGTNVFSAEITNPAKNDVSVTLYAVTYSVENGIKKMTDLDMVTKSVPAGKAADFAATLEITEAADEIKFFAFCDNNLEPITASIGVEFLGTEENNVTVYKINHFE